MNVNLTAELEMFVNERVRSGLYNSASEVVREGLRLLKEQEELKKLRREELKREIAIGLRQLDEGKSKSLTPKVIAGIKARGRAKLAKRQKRNGKK